MKTYDLIYEVEMELVGRLEKQTMIMLLKVLNYHFLKSI